MKTRPPDTNAAAFQPRSSRMRVWMPPGLAISAIPNYLSRLQRLQFALQILFGLWDLAEHKWNI